MEQIVKVMEEPLKRLKKIRAKIRQNRIKNENL